MSNKEAKPKSKNKQLDEALENTFPASDPVAMQSSFHASPPPAPYHEKQTSPQLVKFAVKVILIFVLIMAIMSFFFKAF